VAAVFHHAASEPDGIFDALHHGHASGAQGVPFHDGCIHFDFSQAVKRRSGAGVKERIVFEGHYRGFGGIQRRSSSPENLPAGERGGFASLQAAGEAIVLDRARAAVNDDGRSVTLGHRREFMSQG
jgi:hypothetical protein